NGSKPGAGGRGPRRRGPAPGRQADRRAVPPGEVAALPITPPPVGTPDPLPPRPRGPVEFVWPLTDSSAVRWFSRITEVPFRFKSRGSLVAATVLLQAAVIGLGWLVGMHVAREDVAAKAHDRLTDETVRAVEQFNSQLTRLASAAGPVEYKSP